ncbi:MAG: hypothetical protein Q8S17_12025 [Humidesulfovibrio sp.]|nr:hypothetical protein [Humidesulfovibrio sp.]
MPEQLNQRESARLTALLFLFVSHGSPTLVRDRLPTGDATHNLRETFSQGLTEALADSLRQRPFGPRKHITPDHCPTTA